MSDIPDSISDRDMEVILELANSTQLDDLVSGLESMEAYPEMAWLTAVANQLNTRLRVCYAIAVASATGQLKDLQISIPEEDDSDS